MKKHNTKNVLCLTGGRRGNVSACGIHFLPGGKLLLELVTGKDIDPVGRLQLDFATVKAEGVFTRTAPQIECSYNSHVSFLDASFAQIQSTGSRHYFSEPLNRILAQVKSFSLTAGQFGDFTWTATAKDKRYPTATSSDFADVIFKFFDQLVGRGDARPIVYSQTASEMLDRCRRVAAAGWPFESLPSLP